MRISDWSSDVCSSDLRQPALADAVADAAPQARRVALLRQADDVRQAPALVLDEDRERIERPAGLEIGRAACRERVCPYVSVSVVAVSLQKKQKDISYLQRHAIVNLMRTTLTTN